MAERKYVRWGNRPDKNWDDKGKQEELETKVYSMVIKNGTGSLYLFNKNLYEAVDDRLRCGNMAIVDAKTLDGDVYKMQLLTLTAEQAAELQTALLTQTFDIPKPRRKSYKGKQSGRLPRKQTQEQPDQGDSLSLTSTEVNESYDEEVITEPNGKTIIRKNVRRTTTRREGKVTGEPSKLALLNLTRQLQKAKGIEYTKAKKLALEQLTK